MVLYKYLRECACHRCVSVSEDSRNVSVRVLICVYTDVGESVNSSILKVLGGMHRAVCNFWERAII